MRPAMPLRIAPRHGYTLIEVLVAGAIFVVLGLALVSILSTSVGVWRTHEVKREADGRAAAILSQVERDLGNIDARTTRLGPGVVRPRLLIGYDWYDRPFIVFTTRAAGELENPLTRNSGINAADAPSPSVTPSPRYYHPHGATDNLRAMDGTAEVAYVFGPVPRRRITLNTGASYDGEYYGVANNTHTLQTTGGVWQLPTGAVESEESLGFGLYRGYLAPPGAPIVGTVAGSGSLYAEFDGMWVPNAALAGQGNWWRDSEEVDWLNTFSAALEQKYHLFSDGVLFLGFQWWEAQTANWAPAWGTTTPIPANETEWFQDRFFALDSNRSGFPTTLRLTMATEPLSGARNLTTLLDDVSSTDTDLRVRDVTSLPNEDTSDHFLLIGTEWVWYQNRNGNRFTGLIRGCRGTFPMDHQAGTNGDPVRWGTSYSRVIRIR